MIVIDRFDGEYAWLDTPSGMLRAERRLLPQDVREGDVLIATGDRFAADAEGTKARRDLIAKKRRQALGLEQP